LVRDALDTAHRSIPELSAKRDEIASKIQTSFSELRQALEDREKDLIRQVEQFFGGRTEAAQCTVSLLQKTEERSARVVNSAEQMCEAVPPAVLMRLHHSALETIADVRNFVQRATRANGSTTHCSDPHAVASSLIPSVEDIFYAPAELQNAIRALRAVGNIKISPKPHRHTDDDPEQRKLLSHLAPAERPQRVELEGLVPKRDATRMKLYAPTTHGQHADPAAGYGGRDADILAPMVQTSSKRHQFLNAAQELDAGEPPRKQLPPDQRGATYPTGGTMGLLSSMFLPKRNSGKRNDGDTSPSGVRTAKMGALNLKI
jgi:hypothetical protein